MALFKYPLFCIAVDKDKIFAVVPGQDWQLLDSNLNRIKKILGDWIRREIESYPYYAEPDIDAASARLKIRSIRLRLAYKENKGLYPAPSILRLPVAAVYGQNKEEGYWKCYLPLLDTEFYFYDEQQLDTLIEHFTRDKLEGETPETVHRYLYSAKPWLEELRIQAPDTTSLARPGPHNEEAENHLRAIAERLPAARSVRNENKLIPEVAWERSGLIEQLAAQLLKQRSNILLVGEQSVGKTAVWLETVKRLAQKTRRLDKPLTFWRSSAERMIADARYLGEWQELCERSIGALGEVNGVLWLSDVINLLRIGGEDVEDSVAAFLLPALQNAGLFIIGELTPGELDAARRMLPGFIELFTLVEVEELDRQAMARVLDQLQNYAGSNLQITISPEGSRLAYTLLDRYLRYERFPGKAMRFIGDCLRGARQQQKSRLGEADILQAFIKKTGLPEILLRDDLLLEQQAVNAFFSERIIGQENAISHLCGVISTYKAGLNDPDKPIATLLFAGPTGVGKTAAAKALAAFFFMAGQDREPLFRIDMSEFQHPYQIERLIGADLNRPGKLIQHVRQRPFSVILLDEIEKADSSFFDVLLTIMDEGRFVDAFGRVCDFRNSIIAMTSNLGAGETNTPGFINAPHEDETAAVRRFFRPEFYNRIDKVLRFDTLSDQHIRQIAGKELAALNQREGIAKRELELVFDDTVLDYVCGLGFSPRYGARALQRIIETRVVSALGRFLLQHKNIRKQRLVMGLVNDAVSIRMM